MAFKVGQKVVCVFDYGKRSFKCPSRDEIVTVSGYSEPKYVMFEEYPKIQTERGLSTQCFFEGNFKPLSDLLSEQSDFDLWRIEQEIEEEIMQPA